MDFFLRIWKFSDPIYIVWTFYSYGHFTLWTFSDSSNLYGHFITMDNLPHGFSGYTELCEYSSFLDGFFSYSELYWHFWVYFDINLKLLSGKNTQKVNKQNIRDS